MSYHIIHILHHNSYLSVDRGFLVLKMGESERRAPLSEVLIVVVSARGVSFSSNALMEIIKHGGVIVHCDERYKPIGKTVGYSTVIHATTFQRQIEKPATFCDKLWKELLKAKIENQAHVLDYLGCRHGLWEYLRSHQRYDEGNCARQYWRHYFSSFGERSPRGREYRGTEEPINQLLNYGYAVLSALCHRSLVAHGLQPSPGIHHRFRFKAEPLVYDLMEPLRPVVDFLIVEICQSQPEWTLEYVTREISKRLVNLTIRMGKVRTKLLYSVDRYVSSVAQCFHTGQIRGLIIPGVNQIE